MIIYGHRGAAFYAPENTMASFFLGLQKGANGLETDVQRTKDGELVLFHDSDLKRVLNREGSISEYTLEELSRFDFGVSYSKKYAGERIVRLRDFLYYFYNKPIYLALEIKQEGIEKEFLDMLYSFGSRDHCAVTSFSANSLAAARKLRPGQYLGWLVREVNEKTWGFIKQNRIQELCPKADLITPELVKQAKGQGLKVRAWGVKTPLLMKNAADCGVDGMTVDFPDLLVDYLL